MLDVMISDPLFTLEVLVSGLLSGVMYSLVALGFALIFKASGVFNFAQGAFVLFAALTFVSILEMAWFSEGGGILYFIFCLIIALVVMAVYGIAVERIVFQGQRGGTVVLRDCLLRSSAAALSYLGGGFLEGVVLDVESANAGRAASGPELCPEHVLMQNAGVELSRERSLEACPLRAADER